MQQRLSISIALALVGGITLGILASIIIWPRDQTIIQLLQDNDGSSLLTSAGVRAVYQRRVNFDRGRINPQFILCAEPSPDIASSISDSTDLTGLLENSLQDITSQAKLDLNHASVQGLFKLTERVASIQVMRDVLYRTCEAYANGAIPSTIYMSAIKRAFETNVTLIVAELIASISAKSPENIRNNDGSMTTVTVPKSVNINLNVVDALVELHRGHMNTIDFSFIEQACITALEYTSIDGRNKTDDDYLSNFCTSMLPHLQAIKKDFAMAILQHHWESQRRLEER